MSEDLRSDDAVDRSTVYGSIGLATFLICFGLSYLIPSIFPTGSLFILAGVLILLVNIVKSFKSIGYSMLEILFGAAFIVTGLNRLFELDLGFFPAFIVVLAGILFFQSVKRLKNGEVFD